jgi:polyisoprenoid-binding protein YceI
MKAIARLIVLVALLCAFGPVRAQAARFDIDPEHLSIGFMVDHIGYAKILGMFQKASGSYTFDEATGTLADLRVVIETASIFTSHRKRDDHLKSPDFLNASEFPRMTYTSTSAKRTSERNFVVDGQLELLGKRLPVVLNVTVNKTGNYELPGVKAYVMGVSARGSFKRSAYGMNYGVANGWVGDTVELIIEFEARRK